MRPPYRNYDALKQTHQEVAEQATEPQPVRPAFAPHLRPDAAFLARQAQLELKVTYADALQDQVDRRLISRDDKADRLALFDRGDPEILREAKDIQEARELVADIRKDQNAEQSRDHEIDEPER